MTPRDSPAWDPQPDPAPQSRFPAGTAPRVSIVVLTHNRRDELLRTLRGLRERYPAHPIIVVDNASTDGTAAQVVRRYPDVQLMRAPRNEGAAARNRGCLAARTPYVAFCDDDTCWDAGALLIAERIFDAWPDLGLVSGQVRVGDSGVPDPTCARMARSPLPGLPGVGPGLVGFMAGACVARRDAFLQAGGYWPALFIGGEEGLLALDLLQAGWRIVYAPALVTRHHPSARRNAPQRRSLLARNAVWLAWLRLPVGRAWRETCAVFSNARGNRLALLVAILRGLPRVLARRRVVSPAVLAQRDAVQAAEAAQQQAA